MSIRVPNAPVGAMEIERQLATCYKVLRKIADTACSHGNPTLDRCGPCMAGSFLAQSRTYNPAEAAAPTLPPVGERETVVRDSGEEAERENAEDAELGNDVAREVLCRVFDDDAAFDEWMAFDKSKWLWWGRALGGFIAGRLASRPSPAPSGERERFLSALTDVLYAEHGYSALSVRIYDAVAERLTAAPHADGQGVGDA